MTNQQTEGRPGALHHVAEGAMFEEASAKGTLAEGALAEGTLADGALVEGTLAEVAPVEEALASGPPPRRSVPAARGAPRPAGARAPNREGSRAAAVGAAAVHSPEGHRPGAGRVVLVHGFTQTLASWGPVGERLARRREVVRVDLPGHGGSGGVRAGFPEAAGLVGAVGGPAAYVGYSLGGRVCLRLALDRPDLVRALVLIGASPGIADPAARAERRAADEALAGQVERDGVAAFLDRWLARPLFATLPAAAAGRAERLANTAAGLAYALRELGTGTQEPLWDRLAGLRPPTLLVAGALDPKFAALAEQMAAAIGPAARVALVPGAGHAAHMERPGEVATLVEAFLGSRLPGRPRPTR
jgi:2-succinyl-6-hydroxy-2,4-cyclohexadiene-1-carboxylate synthase